MKLPNFYEFEPLNSIKAKMGIPRDVYGNLKILVAAGRLTELELKKLTSPEGLDISDNDLTLLDDGTLAYKDSRVILYIRDSEVYGNNEPQLPKYHLANCTTLRNMRQNNRIDRYQVSASTDGLFHINIMKSGVVKEEKKEQKLHVCQNCLDLLNFDGFKKKWQRNQRISFVESFKIKNFFEKYPKSLHGYIPKYNSDNAPLNKYPYDFKEISQEIKAASRWRCQCCDIDLSSSIDKKWLHVHHINGLKHDNSKKNLRALCIYCHANQPYHSRHMKNSNYDNFLREKNSFLSNHQCFPPNSNSR